MQLKNTATKFRKKTITDETSDKNERYKMHCRRCTMPGAETYLFVNRTERNEQKEKGGKSPERHAMPQLG